MKENIPRLVDSLLKEAYEQKASDVHIFPKAESLLVRFRIDGMLYNKRELKKSLQEELIGRIKILANLKLDEHVRPQDGRFAFKLNNDNSIDIRLSILPTYFGENAVLRLLYAQNSFSLQDIGFSKHDIGVLQSALTFRSGLFLVTGPTGSGKTSTLYSLIHLLKHTENSLITLEDPIEYALPGITQTQVREELGLGFSKVLRSVLRQDPDIVMVGEIRDKETAQTAINAALTGHLILSTLHTNNAVSVIPRLVDMGIEPYLIASTLKVVIAQRLVRKLDHESLSGRTCIAEVLSVTPAIVSAIEGRKTLKQILMMAKREGMVDMIEDGLQKVEAGVTTKEEVFRVIHE